jgi:hypothetical protein
MASEALVLPVLAHAARRAPTRRAWANAAVIPLSLKLPDGFIPSYWRNSRPGLIPTYLPTVSARWLSVCPSPMVRMRSSWANGNSSRNRQTPLNSSGSVRRAHLASNSRSDFGGRTRSQS